MRQKILGDITALGASTSAFVEVKDIKFSPQFHAMCKQNYCGNYGKNYACPPYVGSFEEVTDRVKQFDYGWLFQTIHPLEDSFDFEGMKEGQSIHMKNLQKIVDYIKDNVEYEKMLFLGAEGCKVCKKCGILTDEPCRFPDKAIGSLEGYCIDVAALTISHGLKYINGENTVSYVGLVLLKNRGL